MNRPTQRSKPAIACLLLSLMTAFAVLGNVSAANASTTILVLSAGDESTQSLLQTNTEAALRDADIRVATMQDAMLAGFDPKFTIGCLDNDEVCDALLKKAPAEWVLLMRLRVSGDGPDADRTVIAQLYSADDGALLQVEQRVCQRCASNERLIREITELVQELARDEVANKANQTYLDVTSTPPQAILRIDGVVVGQTGQPYRVRPGEHTIQLEHEGYRVASQTLTVGANEHKALSVSLSKSSQNTSQGGGLRRTLSLGSLALGGGALIAGVGFLVVDGDSSSDGSRDRVRDTRSIGIGSLVAGTVLVGAGIALLVTEDDDPRDVHVSAIPSETGLSFGLSGHF